MKPLTRREVLLPTLTAGALAACRTLLPAADQPAAVPALDPHLETAQSNPQVFMFVEQVTTRADDARHHLVITSACDARGKPEEVIVRHGTIRVFRADTRRDDFTKTGGWYWRCGDQSGQTRFEKQSAFQQPGQGPLVMVICLLDGTVHWSLLQLDLRC